MSTSMSMSISNLTSITGGYVFTSVCLLVYLSVYLPIARISTKGIILIRCSCKFVEGLGIHQDPNC